MQINMIDDMNKKITVTAANKLFFVFAVLYMLFQVILVILSVTYGGEILEDNTYKILLVNQYVIILLPVMFFAWVNRLNIREVFRLNRLGLVQGALIVVIIVLGYIPAVLLNNVLVYVLQFIGSVPNIPLPIPQNAAELLKGIAVVAISPAICEEMLHRGILLKAYERRGSMKAVVITAVFFGLFHFDLTNLFGATFMGLLIGYFVIRTNSIYAGILAHFLNNAISEVAMFIYGNTDSASKDQAVTLDDIGQLIIWGAICLIAIWILLKVFNRITHETYKPKLPISSIKNDTISILSHWPIIVILTLYLILAILFLLSLS